MKQTIKHSIRRRDALHKAFTLGTTLWMGGSLVAPVLAGDHSTPVVQAGGGAALSNGSVVSRVWRLPPVDHNVKRVVVTAIAVDPRGEFLAVAGDDHVIRILNAETLRVVHVLGDGGSQKKTRPGHFDWIRTMAFDDSGSRLVSAGNDGQLILWDRRRDFAVLQEIDSAPALACVRFSVCGKQMAAVGFDQQVFLIGPTSSGMPKLTCGCVDLRCCAYRDDGRMLAVAGRDGHLHLFDPVKGNTLLEIELHSARVRDIEFMPDSNVLVSVAEDGEMIRFDTEQQVLLSRQKITTGRLFSLAVLDQHTLAAAGSDDGIHVVRVGADGRSLHTENVLTGHVGSVSTLVVSNGVLISGGFDATLRRWELSATLTPESKIAFGNDSESSASNPTPR